MVNMKVLASIIALMVASPLAAALPTAPPAGNTAPSTSSPDTTPFSFEDWADSIAKGTPHKTIEEAIRAGHEPPSGSHSKRGELLEKRLRCNHLSIGSASVPDAVACINYLASSGRTCRVEGPNVAFCTIGNAQIVGVRGSSGPTESSCVDIARAAGAVMDACWRADNTVQGDHYAHGNGNIAVHIAAPSL